MRVLSTWPLLTACVLAAKECWWPDGSLDTESTACNEEAGQSQCCPPDHYCLDNNYCFGGSHYGNRLTRWSCTDKTWDDSTCPQYCSDQGGGSWVSIMLAQDADISTFCCTDSSSNYNATSNYCSYPTLNSNTPFNLTNGQIIVNRTTGSTVLADNVVNGTAVATVTTTVTATAQGNASNSASHDTSLGVGLGVGLGIPLVLLCAAVSILWRRRRKESLGYQQPGHVDTTTQKSHGAKEQQQMRYEELDNSARPYELRGNTVAELYGDREAELDESTSPK